MLILTGLLVGILSGLFGIGGGSLYVTVLVLCFSQTQQAAQGISLLVILPTALLGGSFYLRKNLIEKEIILPLICGGVIGALIGAFIANHIDTHILSKAFALVLLFSGIKMLRE